MKVAIYVEGITEACFVYQLIKEYYQANWAVFRLECLHLDPSSAIDYMQDYGDANAQDYFLIYDSGSDNAVSTDLKDRIDRHCQEGFDKVVGLRDVYSERYKELYPQQFNSQSISSFIKDMRDALTLYDNKGLIRLRFAIMEIEAWLLAMSEVFQRIDNRLNTGWLQKKAGVDPSKDPETEYFHPFSKVEDIYISISRTYSKHWDEIKEIICKLNKQDFDNLYNSNKCQSFRDFYDAIFK